MHVAVCDDNVADRKQSERLLKRESDKRLATSGNLYIDSYGNAASLLQNPMQYDVFFIDMCKGELTGIDVLKQLTAKGSSAPVVLCCSDLNYREMPIPEDAREQVIFLDKPIQAAKLAQVLDQAQAMKDASVQKIELREEKQTYYVTEPDILYAREDGQYIHVTLLSGKVISVIDTAVNFFYQVESYPTFFSPNHKTVLNGRYIEKTAFHKVTMKDGHVFTVTGSIMKYAQKIFREYHAL